MADEDFINYIWPHAVAASEATGVDPRIIAGQAAVESGWGKHVVGNNLFGIKGPGVNALTTEVGVNGPYQTQSSFRAYDTPADSVSGYADFINSNPRYSAFQNSQDIRGQLTALQRSGYATDPQYAGKVANAASAIDLAVRKKDAANWSGQPGTPTDIKTALGYTGQPEPAKAEPVSDTSSDFFKDMGLTPKKADTPTSPAADQGGDFFRDMGLKPPEAKAAPAGQKSGSAAIPPGDTAAAIGSGIGDLPIVGPYIKEGMIRGAAAIGSVVNPALGFPAPSADDIRQWDAQLKKDNPYGYMGGQALGTSAALLPLASTAAGAVAFGAKAPAFVTDALGALPTLARLGTQAGIGGTTNALISGTDAAVRGENPLVAGAVGGALGAGGPIVGAGAVGAGRVGRSLVEPFLPGGPQRIADRVLAKAAAEKLTADASKAGNVPGSTPTLAESTGNAGVAGLERAVRSTPEGIVPFNLRDEARANARGELVSNVRGDPVSLEGLIADRQAATDPLREAAFANAGKADPSNVVKKIDEILAGPDGKRDAVVQALSTIKRKIVTGGGESADPMSALTGAVAKPPTLENDPNLLYGVRKAINDILDQTGPKTADDARRASSQLLDVKNELDKSLNDAAPGFQKYIDKFADLSKPIDAEKWMQGLNLTDMRGKVTLGQVNRAISSTEKARARGGANDAKAVPDEVMQKLYGLRDDLRSQLDAAERGRAAGSPTVQNLATQNFAQSAGIPLTTAATIASGHPLIGVPVHWLSRAIEARNPAVTNALINRLLSPEVPQSSAFAGNLPGAGMLNPGALLAPGLIPSNRNRLTER
jgi:hypothetical protein